MLDTLSRSQKTAYDALGLGPVWLNRAQSSEKTELNDSPSGEQIPLALVFKGSDGVRSDPQTQLLAQLLRSIGRNLEQAHLCGIDGLKAENRYELMLVFGAGSTDEIDALMASQDIQIESRVDLQSLDMIAADSKAKASTWNSLKKLLL
jgi:hypothetical protein